MSNCQVNLSICCSRIVISNFHITTQWNGTYHVSKEYWHYRGIRDRSPNFLGGQIFLVQVLSARSALSACSLAVAHLSHSAQCSALCHYVWNSASFWQMYGYSCMRQNQSSSLKIHQTRSLQFNSIYSNQSFVDTVINKVWIVTQVNDGYGPRKAQLMIGAHLHCT